MSQNMKRWWVVVLSCSALFAVLHGCGGGGQTASNNTGGVGSGGTGSYTNGPISGLGSIFVNGVRYDVSAATLLSDDTLTPLADDLKIGVVVEVDGGEVTSDTGGSKCKAVRVRYAAELIGQVTADNTSSGVRRLTVMGQSVAINAATQPLDPSIGPGSTVKVYGLPGATGVFTATLVLPVSAPAAYKISGVVSAVDANARTITIGSGPQVVHYASGALPSGVGVDSYVRAQVSVTPLAANEWTALSGAIKVRAPLVADQRDGRLEGVVQPMNASSTTMGYINGTQVDFTAVLSQLVAQCKTTPTTPFTIADCAGARVEVEGLYNSGILTASKAKRDDDSQSSEHELVGRVGTVTAGPSTTTFTLTRNSTTYAITQDASTELEHGLTLQSGLCVQVKWKTTDPATPSQLLAEKIEPDSGCQ